MASNADLLEEVVVTATKRAQTLQETPIAVSVISANTIEKAALQDIGDPQAVVPTSRVSQLQSSANTGFAILPGYPAGLGLKRPGRLQQGRPGRYWWLGVKQSWRETPRP